MQSDAQPRKIGCCLTVKAFNGRCEFIVSTRINSFSDDSSTSSTDLCPDLLQVIDYHLVELAPASPDCDMKYRENHVIRLCIALEWSQLTKYNTSSIHWLKTVNFGLAIACVRPVIRDHES
jgi:hypothetical protein